MPIPVVIAICFIGVAILNTIVLGIIGKMGGI
jgi:hypothetical protein